MEFTRLQYERCYYGIKLLNSAANRHINFLLSVFLATFLQLKITDAIYIFFFQSSLGVFIEIFKKIGNFIDDIYTFVEIFFIK